MSKDDEPSPAAAADAPEASKGWSEQDRRTLIITIGGGLAANLGTVILVGAAIAFVRVTRHHYSPLGLGLLSLGIIASSALVIVWGNASRRGRDFVIWRGFGLSRFSPRAGWLLLGLGSIGVLETVLIVVGVAVGVK